MSGGIACYKSCELVRELKRRGATVRVMMTPSAREFVTPLTFAALSENPVLTSLFPAADTAAIAHINWSRWGDLIIVCPATANTLARLANGFADEPVSATIRAARVPVVLCPAMNAAMWEDPLVQRNLQRLRQAGYRCVDPEFGELATTTEGAGWGRLARLEWILAAALAAAQPSQPLQGMKVLVTAGRTEEYLDPVRMLTNPSSGRMGFAVAEAAWVLGAEVVLVHGPTELPPPYKIQTVPVVSANDMREAVLAHYPGAQVVVMTAAVSDYRPRQRAAEKIKKSSATTVLELEANDDILRLLSRQKTAAVHVGFALETENAVPHAQQKLREKALDLIVLNEATEAGAGFKGETNRVTLIDAAGNITRLPLLSKSEVAFEIWQAVLALPAAGQASIARTTS
ncbi:bifunctional phosphopantothenoylcysteine decarboxylase/phosphopantothenate--cysteine ligase CoaBC [bacterium]|nr:bifunctional phosphopantothenoylcysteine decarboxylase/phosphopantothenate--cysteine ligase CoaBC [bacterium]